MSIKKTTADFSTSNFHQLWMEFTKTVNIFVHDIFPHGAIQNIFPDGTTHTRILPLSVHYVEDLTNRNQQRDQEILDGMKALPVDCQRIILSYAANPLLPNDGITYRMILEAYKEQGILESFQMNVPHNPHECEGRLKVVFHEVMQLVPPTNLLPSIEQDWYRERSFLALAPVMEMVEDRNLISLFNTIMLQFDSSGLTKRNCHSSIEKSEAEKASQIRSFLRNKSGHLYNTWRSYKRESEDLSVTVMSLDLSYTQLSTLPPEIDCFSKLRTLDLTNRGLAFLPESIGHLANLEELTMTANKLSFLPRTFGKLKNLKRLFLGRNRFSIVPQSIFQLEGLQHLGISENQLTSLPSQIAQLYNLRSLALDNLIKNGNQIAELPLEVLTLSKLEKLDLTGNPCVDKSKELINQLRAKGCFVST